MSSSKAYDEYKKVKHALFNQIPTHWELFKASHLFDNIGSGTTPKSDNQRFYEDGEVFWLTTGDLNDKNLTSCDGKITRKALEEHSALTEYPEGSVAIAMYGATIGKTALLQFRTTTNQACCVFPTSDKINNKYFHYQLLSLKPYILSLAVGGGQPNINQEILRSLKITVPKYEEQLLIAGFLDIETKKIDALIAEQEKLIELLQEKRQAVISHAVTKGLNPDAPMKDSGVEWLGEVPEHWGVMGLTKTIGPIVDYRGRTPTKCDSGTLLVTAKNIRNGEIDYALSEEYVDPLEAEQLLQRGRPALGDVLFTMEAPLGQVALVDREDIALAQRVVKFRGAIGRMTNSFLMWWLIGSACQQQLNSLSTGSTALGIKASKLSAVVCGVPPVKEQQAIDGHIRDSIGQLKSVREAAETQVELLQERRSALISAAVTGQIDVRGLVPQQEAV